MEFKMQNTWIDMVDSRIDRNKRACVFCGMLNLLSNKVISVDEMYDLLEKQKECLSSEIVHCTYKNICDTATSDCFVKLSKQDETFHCCQSCNHWIQKRFAGGMFLFPFQALKFHFQCMMPIQKKCLDTRVIFRLCCMLVQTVNGKSNFFRCLFSQEELDICEKVSKLSVCDVTPIIAMYIYNRDGKPLFGINARFSEIIRDHEARQTKEDQYRDQM